MTKKKIVPIPGIDLTFHPSTYFWPLSLETHLLASIKGAERQAMVRDAIRKGNLDAIPDDIARSALSEADRLAVGRMHPAFMGGEYLPDHRENEVEIARVTIASVTQDVTSIFARRGRHRIHYRVVDEYEGDTLCGPTARTSTRPLSLAALEQFFDSAWSIFDLLEMNYGDDGHDIGTVQSFFRASSPFYPQFTALYQHRIAVWWAERRAAA